MIAGLAQSDRLTFWNWRLPSRYVYSFGFMHTAEGHLDQLQT